MEKFAQDLKERFLHLVDAIRSCKTAKGNEIGEETNLNTVKKVKVQSRELNITTARGPTTPKVSVGAPPQTN
ncbi:hypothetical protein ACSBR2_009170 [Camellia fascicularis]